jgi:hypothetical protein
MTPQDRVPPHDSASGQPPTRLCESSEGMQAAPARWAVTLLRAAKPYEPAPGRRERVWSNLRAVDRVSRPGRLRVAFAAVLLLVAGLFASAAFAFWPGWLARAIRAVPNEANEGRAGLPARSAPATAERPAPMPSLVSQPALAPSPPLEVASGASSGAAHARRPSRLDSPEESELLLDAMRALRVERNPGRARAVLLAYLAHHPKGALAEEALVMLVEAAVANGDSDASALAARYFALYPKGGFTEQVRRALAGPPGSTK